MYMYFCAVLTSIIVCVQHKIWNKAERMSLVLVVLIWYRNLATSLKIIFCVGFLINLLDSKSMS